MLQIWNKTSKILAAEAGCHKLKVLSNKIHQQNLELAADAAFFPPTFAALATLSHTL